MPEEIGVAHKLEGIEVPRKSEEIYQRRLARGDWSEEIGQRR